ncbi:MAG: transcriptional regulator with XRE-family HTH domain, partial [Rickettsiales bacterium]
NKGLTLDNVSKRTGVSYVTLSKLENENQNDIRMFTLFSIINGLDIDPLQIFDKKELEKVEMTNQNILSKTEIETLKKLQIAIKKLGGKKFDDLLEKITN